MTDANLVVASEPLFRNKISSAGAVSFAVKVGVWSETAQVCADISRMSICRTVLHTVDSITKFLHAQVRFDPGSISFDSIP